MGWNIQVLHIDVKGCLATMFSDPNRCDRITHVTVIIDRDNDCVIGKMPLDMSKRDPRQCLMNLWFDHRGDKRIKKKSPRTNDRFRRSEAVTWLFPRWLVYTRIWEQTTDIDILSSYALTIQNNMSRRYTRALESSVSLPKRYHELETTQSVFQPVNTEAL